MAEPAEVPVPLAALPPELLAHILSFVRRPARLTMASLVCKRWRTAALNSMSSFRVSHKNYVIDERNRRAHSYAPCERGPPCLATRATSLFSALQDLSLYACAATHVTFSIPSTLRALSLTINSMSRADSTAVLHSDGHRFFRPGLSGSLPSLTHLSYTAREKCSADYLLPLLSASLASLTSLSLHIFHWADAAFSAPMKEFLCGAHFPKLKSLSLHGDGGIAVALIANHASQLTSLSLGLATPKLCNLPAPFPALRTLAFDFPMPLSSLDVHAMVARCPSLVDFELITNSASTQMLPLELHRLLTAVTVYNMDVEQERETLRTWTSLRRLQCVRISKFSYLDWLASVRDAVTQLHVPANFSSAPMVLSGGLRNLATLRLPAATEVPEDALLPALRELWLAQETSDPMRPMEGECQRWRQLCAACPRLECLTFPFYGAADARVYDIVAEFLLWLAARGLQEGSFYRGSDSSPLMQQMLARVRSEARDAMEVHWRDEYHKQYKIDA